MVKGNKPLVEKKMLIISSILGRINVWDFFFTSVTNVKGLPFLFQTILSTSLAILPLVYDSSSEFLVVTPLLGIAFFSLAFVYGNSTPVIIRLVFTAVRFHKLIEKMTFVLNNVIFINIYISSILFFHVPSIVLHYSAWCCNIS